MTDVEAIARGINNTFQRHFLALHVGWLFQGESHNAWISGFLVRVQNFLLWMTAGHVVNKLNELVKTPGVGGLKWRFIDNHTDQNADFIPCDFSSLYQIALDHDGYDFSCIILPPYLSLPLLKSDQNVPISESFWKDYHFEFNEMYLVGIPTQFTNSIQNDTANKLNILTLAERISLPLQMAACPLDTDYRKFWGYSNSVYAEVLPVHSDAGQIITNIAGMSGGPIFGIKWLDAERFTYQILAIQSEWLSDIKIIRAPFFYTIIDAISNVLSKLKNVS
jgi:hypothetical protein